MFKMTLFGKSFELTEETLSAVAAQIEEAAKALLVPVQNELKTMKEAIGEATIDEVRKMVADAKSFRESTVAEAVKYGALVGMIAADKVEAQKALFLTLPLEHVKQLEAQYKQIWNERNEQEGKLKETEKGGEKKEVAIEATSYAASEY